MTSGGTRKPRLRYCGRITDDGTPCIRQIRYAAKCGAKHRGDVFRPRAKVSIAARTGTLPRPSIIYAASKVVRQSPNPVVSAVQVAEEIATSGWKAAASQRLSTYIGNQAYSAIDNSWKPKHCKKLAEAARRLSAVGSRADTLSQALDRCDARSLVTGSELALAFVDQAQSLHSPLDAAANSLRLSGIILCATHNCLGDCECLKDLAEEAGMPALRSAILSTCGRFLGV
jgi:murein DD-endopeptidase MepM/ murein hydrolase activator NlpD